MESKPEPALAALCVLANIETKNRNNLATADFRDFKRPVAITRRLGRVRNKVNLGLEMG